jgi:hypothetical protein
MCLLLAPCHTCTWYNTRNAGLFLGASFISIRGNSCSQRRGMQLVIRLSFFLCLCLCNNPLGHNIHHRQILLNEIIASLSTSMSCSQRPIPLEQNTCPCLYQCHVPNAPILLYKVSTSLSLSKSW